MRSHESIQITDHPDGGYRLSTEQLIERPRAEVFELFADAFQLQRLTPPWLHFQVLTPPPVKMRQGLLLDYKIRLHQIPIRWRTLIDAWEPPYRFVDLQVRGPYRRWHHEHRFVETDGGTLVQDVVHYIPRGGRLVHHWFVRPDLLKIFDYRREQMALIFPSRSHSTGQTARSIDSKLSKPVAGISMPELSSASGSVVRDSAR